MGQAIVAGDQVKATCAIHMFPSAVGAPQPAGPLPFSAPLTTGLAQKVTIGGKPAAVMGSGGVNTPPHMGLHPSDPFMAPPTQQALIISGSPTVLIEGKPAATTDSMASACGIPGATCVPTVATVSIG
jgi:uncharacterized Zn-binding protein involved in type VI secretion